MTELAPPRYLAPQEDPPAPDSHRSAVVPVGTWTSVEPVPDVPRDLTPLVTTLRWATVAVGVLLTAYNFQHLRPGITLVALGAVTGLSLWRTFRPILPVGSFRRFSMDMALDGPVTLGAVATTGAFGSPLALTMAPIIFLAAYRAGYLRGACLLVPPFVLIATVQAFHGLDHEISALIAQGALLYLLTAALGAFSRNVVASARERAHAIEVERTLAGFDAERMAAANDLLLALYDVTRNISASLDLGELVASTQRRFRELFDYTTAVIVVRDDSGDSWRVELADGTRLPASLPAERLPWDLDRAISVDGPRIEPDLVAGKRSGCSPYGRSALYTPLRTPDGLVGLLALEHSQADHFTPRDLHILEALAKPLALALDNARWFGKLRRIGAEAERARIARDLHDRFAQSLAYVGFELERLGADDGSRRDSLLELRDLVRELVAELRDLLHELRTGVDEATSLADAIRDHAKRFADRTGLEVHLDVPDDELRLPLHIEQELWRIVQESLTNVERHARARNVWITWAVTSHRATLAIRDDGRGFLPEAVARDRFGLVGIRERADTIDARVEIHSRVGAGAELTVRAPVPA